MGEEWIDLFLKIGILPTIIFWFMFRLEKKLEQVIEALNNHTENLITVLSSKLK